MVALYTVWYNFVKQHKSLQGITPAMAAGVTDKLWDMKDVAALVDAAAPKPGRRGTYKERNGRSIVSDIDYNEIVSLVRAQGEPEEMSLAEAVRTVMSWPDLRDRMTAAILSNGEPLLDSKQIEAVSKRSDFPISN